MFCKLFLGMLLSWQSLARINIRIQTVFKFPTVVGGISSLTEWENHIVICKVLGLDICSYFEFLPNDQLYDVVLDNPFCTTVRGLLHFVSIFVGLLHCLGLYRTSQVRMCTRQRRAHAIVACNCSCVVFRVRPEAILRLIFLHFNACSNFLAKNIAYAYTHYICI